MSFVVDASFAAAWCFEDEVTANTEKMFRQARDRGIVIPMIWYYEMANVIRTAERRERISRENGDYFLSVLRHLAAQDDDFDRERIWIDVLQIARKHNLTVYDAGYVELAARTELPLASRDKEMIVAALAEGIEIIPA